MARKMWSSLAVVLQGWYGIFSTLNLLALLTFRSVLRSHPRLTPRQVQGDHNRAHVSRWWPSYLHFS